MGVGLGVDVAVGTGVGVDVGAAVGLDTGVAVDLNVVIVRFEQPYSTKGSCNAAHFKVVLEAAKLEVPRSVTETMVAPRFIVAPDTWASSKRFLGPSKICGIAGLASTVAS